MKTRSFIPWLIAILAVIAALLLWLRLRNLDIQVIPRICAERYTECVEDCDQQFRIDTLSIQRGSAELLHNQNLLQCHLQNIGNPAAAELCRQEENERHAQVLAGFQAQIDAFRTVRDTCEAQ